MSFCLHVLFRAGRKAANKLPLSGDPVAPRCGGASPPQGQGVAGETASLGRATATRRGVVDGAILQLCILVAAGMLLAGMADAAQVGGRHAAIVADANNGAVLHADKADELRFPASLTKIMTLYLAFEAIEQGRVAYSTRLKVSQVAANQPPTSLDLDPGETITLIDAMKGLITKSANDAAVVIAEHLAGSEARFAQMMTDKARRFGMSRTTFRNASGLPDPGQVTTARDMLTLALRIQDDFPTHYRLFAIRSFAYEGTTYRNHNNLLFRFQGTDGIKTGYTRSSGFNLVSSVRRGGRHVIGVVLGGRTAARRDDAMQLLVSRALLQASPYKTRKSAPVLTALARPVQRTVVAQRAAPIAPPRVVPAVPPPEPILVKAPAPVVRPAAGSVQRGAPPSTLNQQAQALAHAGNMQGPPVAASVVAGRRLDPPYAVRGPAVPQLVAAAGGTFEIQIGAYGTAGEAERALAATRAAVGRLLEPYPARAVAAQKQSRRIFRARFVGFDSAAAASTCLELRRRQVDCFVMRGE